MNEKETESYKLLMEAGDTICDFIMKAILECDFHDGYGRQLEDFPAAHDLKDMLNKLSTFRDAQEAK